MTGEICHRQTNMTVDRGAEAASHADDGTCSDSRVSARIPANLPEVNFYAQAEKALCLRSPFEGSDEAALPGTLPRNLAGFLLRHSDSRKRHKKSHPGSDNLKKKKKSSSRLSEKSKLPGIWLETEEYFRDLTIADIGNLSDLSKFGTNSAAPPACFLIPAFVDSSARENESKNSGHENGTVLDGRIEKPEEKDGCDNGNGLVIEEHSKKIEEENDNVEDNGFCQILSVPESPKGMEWLLGSRNKISVTSEQQLKKLASGDAALEKILVACPCEGKSTLCHFCSCGDPGNELNHLVTCSSCQVSVHRKCYGVGGAGNEPLWVCSWCRHKAGSKSDSEKPCVLCPKQGGALKPLFRSVECTGPVEFAHLFCSLWMPGVYIEDLEKIEPIMKVEATKATRNKLVCNICKVKWGACVRCGHGTCKSSFHPLCAREARHRMEVWGRYGCENVELRAFCSKHSDIVDDGSTSKSGDPIVAGSNSNSVNCLPEKSNVSCRNGDSTEVPDTNSGGSFDNESQDTGLDARLLSLCNDSQLKDNVNVVDSNFSLIFKKLIDRGKIKLEDVASQIGVSVDSLSTSLEAVNMVPGIQCKVVNWLKNNVHLNAVQKNVKVQTRSMASFKDEFGAVDDSNAASVSESEMADRVAVKSVPPRRRTKSSIRVLNDPKKLCSSEDILSGRETVVDDVKEVQIVNKEPETTTKASILNVAENNVPVQQCPDPRGIQQDKTLSFSEGSGAVPVLSIPQQSDQAEDDLVLADGNPAACSAIPGLQNCETVTSYYIHPEIKRRLLQVQNGVGLNSPIIEINKDSGDGKASSSTDDIDCRADLQLSEQLMKAREAGILELAPEDEVEGEIVYFQNRLLSNAALRKGFTDKLICSVAKSLPLEIHMTHAKRWDDVLVNRYLSEHREAKKQGRKEKRHREAQAVLAAAAAAAAASSRMSSFRKDGDDPNHLENTSGRLGSNSQPIPRAKEMLQRATLVRQSDLKDSVVDFSKGQPRSCDICSRSETLLNPILACCSCKVVVHLDCYRSVKESSGPWYCELCEEFSSSVNSGASAASFQDKPYLASECGLCGGTSGALRKCSDGQWVHAFCAEWVFESRFKRGQVDPVEGMETISKGTDSCHLCKRKCGICVKCNFGHCQATFHPWCARNAGFYLNVKAAGGKQQHKAYCEKHSADQRTKAEAQKHGVEELKSLKQVRVELERLRLLCERLIRREKLKRELVICAIDILAVKRDHAARYMILRSPYLHPDVSSESVTTSLKGHTEGFSEAIQRSDDVTVDSTVSVKRRGRASDDQRTEDDCSTSQNQLPRKVERPRFAGKQIPNRSSSFATRTLMEDTRKLKDKKQETFEKELVMTSDQASVKNMRLPKGYAYVPADVVSKDKKPNLEPGSTEPSERARAE